jgi:hypothetical protein
VMTRQTNRLSGCSCMYDHATSIHTHTPSTEQLARLPS